MSAVAPELDVHTEHCCKKHGCKYSFGDVESEAECTVVNGEKSQSFPCETCEFAVEQLRHTFTPAEHALIMRGLALLVLGERSLVPPPNWKELGALIERMTEATPGSES